MMSFVLSVLFLTASGPKWVTAEMYNQHQCALAAEFMVEEQGVVAASCLKQIEI